MVFILGDKTYYLRAELSLQIESRARVSSHVAERREKVGIDGAESSVVSAAHQILFSNDCSLYCFFITAFSKRPMIRNAKTIRECIRDVTSDIRPVSGSAQFWCGSGSGSADPCLCLMDPDPDSSIFIIDLQDANKKRIF